MKLKVYTILDTCDGKYEFILTAPTDATMERSLVTMFTMGRNNPIVENFEDKTLYFVGEFDTETGVIIPASLPKFVTKLEALYDKAIAKMQRFNERAVDQVKNLKVEQDKKLKEAIGDGGKVSKSSKSK